MLLLRETVNGNSEVIEDDPMSFQNGERIAGSSELEIDWFVTGSTILKAVLGVSNGEIGEVFMKPYYLEKINRFENMGLLMIKDTESVGVDVQLQKIKELIEVVDDVMKSEIVHDLMENDDNILSPAVDGADETQAENTEVSPSTESEHQNEEVLTEKDIGYKTEAEICDDSEQAQFEVEAADTDEVILIFPISFESLDSNIQFGSFNLTDDTKSHPKVSNPETEPKCGVNSNRRDQIISYLLDDIDAGQGDSQWLGFPFNVQIGEPMVATRSASPSGEPSCDDTDESSLVLPDEPFCVFPDDSSHMVLDDKEEKIASNLGSTLDEVEFSSAVTNLETEKAVESVEENHMDNQNKENLSEEFQNPVKNEERSEAAEIIDIEKKEKTDKLMKEEIKAELKERIRLEEKMKAIEANERRKQNAQKAQTQAQMLGLKEAQKRENLRLKRLRKRERMRAAKHAVSSTIDDLGTAGSNMPKEMDNKNTNTKGKSQQQSAPPHFLQKQLKPKFTPPPLAGAAVITYGKPWRNWRNFVISTIMVLILCVFFIQV